MATNKNREPMLREECYNCYNLTGYISLPVCSEKQNPDRSAGASPCDKYKPIVKEER